MMRKCTGRRKRFAKADGSLHWKSSKSRSLALAEPYNTNMLLNRSSYIISNTSELGAKSVSYCELLVAAASRGKATALILFK